ncbi:hypothetical protein UA75_20780 [Actinoalloteichus sp. GBA129-24]|uniref:Uncharacterized protein n=1 Tax=Actinoalloteichus fjordicus TaxID=1612552 RepID=A0AAC9LFT8_9PSEU|nr:hypothetical protein UA74_20275 [Actinoalloteichus fjordicus]APU22145.1 hypothetical protein UA75_20780 [Actinoalloteichus sp. GBA129-24]
MAVSSALDAADPRAVHGTGRSPLVSMVGAALSTREGDPPIIDRTGGTAMPILPAPYRPRPARHFASTAAVMLVRSERTLDREWNTADDPEARRHRACQFSDRGRRPESGRTPTPTTGGTSDRSRRRRRTTARPRVDAVGDDGTATRAADARTPHGLRHRSRLPRPGSDIRGGAIEYSGPESRRFHFSAATTRSTATTSGKPRGRTFDGLRSAASEGAATPQPCPTCDTCNNQRAHPLGIDTNVRLCRVPEELIMKQEKTSKNSRMPPA